MKMKSLVFVSSTEPSMMCFRLGSAGFDAFKEELGPSRDSTLPRGVSLDVSYDEQDLMKVRRASHRHVPLIFSPSLLHTLHA